MTFRKRHNAHTNSRKKAHNKADFLLVTFLQSVLCAVMIAAAFVMSSVMGMTEIKSAYNSLASNETDAVAVFSVMQNAAKSEKAIRFREVLRLIIDKAFEREIVLASGGMMKYSQNTIPNGVFPIAPLTSSPMKIPLEGMLTSPFGPRQNPITQKADWHSGIDLAAPEGTAIGAAWPGTVCFVGGDNIYGNYITVDHGGFKTRYCHCSDIAAKVGMKVRQGETVAFSGNTGYSTGPHLHFELIIDEKCADPLHEQPRWEYIEAA